MAGEIDLDINAQEVMGERCASHIRLPAFGVLPGRSPRLSIIVGICRGFNDRLHGIPCDEHPLQLGLVVEWRLIYDGSSDEPEAALGAVLDLTVIRPATGGGDEGVISFGQPGVHITR